MPAPIVPGAQQLLGGNNNGGFLDRLGGNGQQVAFIDTGIQSFVGSGISSSGGFTTSDKSAFTPYDDPTYLGFKIVLDFSTSPLLAGTLVSDPAQSQSASTLDASALSYLKKVAPSRADYLLKFANTLNDIQTQRHYFFQSIEGLDGIWKMGSKFMSGDPYRGGEESKITIKCLESVDLKTTSIMALYRNALLDMKMRRIILPRNLREFTVTIYIQEIRNFKAVVRRLAKTGESETGSAANFVNDNVSTIAFTLKNCELVPESSSSFLENVSNTGNEQISNSISFTYEDVSEVYEFMGLGDQVLDTNTSSNIPAFINTVAQRAAEFAKNAAAKQVGKLLSNASLGPFSIPNPFSLGNAYGPSINNLTAEGIIAGISTLRAGEVGDLGEISTGNTVNVSPLEPSKAFEDVTSPLSEIGQENVYSGEIIPNAEDISSSNNVYQGVIPPSTGGNLQGSVDRSGGQSGESLPGNQNVYGNNLPSGPRLNPDNVFE